LHIRKPVTLKILLSFFTQALTKITRNLYNGKYTPPWGKEYQLMSSGGKYEKGKRKTGEYSKGIKGKEKEKMGSRMIK
jgi:hypothetical protein